jgi:hypothetical protein
MTQQQEGAVTAGSAAARNMAVAVTAYFEGASRLPSSYAACCLGLLDEICGPSQLQLLPCAAAMCMCQRC